MRPGRPLAALLALGLVGISALASPSPTSSAFAPAAQFERWSHFRDYGIPGTVHDPLNQAAIADGSCRMLGGPIEGYALWHHPERVKAVLSALASTPSTGMPSNFTLSAADALDSACDFGQDQAAPLKTNFSVDALAATLTAWNRALCAPPDDPSWKGAYDPANQPQQIALTAGFSCIVACDLGAKTLPASAMAALAASPANASSAVCSVLPWDASAATRFTRAKTGAELASITAPLVTRPCQCGA